MTQSTYVWGAGGGPAGREAQNIKKNYLYTNIEVTRIDKRINHLSRKMISSKHAIHKR